MGEPLGQGACGEIFKGTKKDKENKTFVAIK